MLCVYVLYKSTIDIDIDIKYSLVYTADSIRNRIGRPIRFEIRFERKKTIRRSLVITLFKVTDFGTKWKTICDFLLVSDTNLQPIPHHF